MSTPTAYPSTSPVTGSHRKPREPAENIAALRTAVSAGVLGDGERERYEHQLAEHRAVIEKQNAAMAELGHRLMHAEEAESRAQAEAAFLRGELRTRNAVAEACRRAADRWRAEAADLLVKYRILRQQVESAENQAAVQAPVEQEPWRPPRWRR